MNKNFTNIRIILAITIYFIFTAQAVADGLKLVYKETHKDQTSYADYVLEYKDNKRILQLKNEAGTATLVSDKDYFSYYGLYNFQDSNKQVEIKRINNELAIYVKGNLVKKEKLQPHPWYANYVLLQGFVLSKQTQALHYLIVPENQSIMELVQINEGLENVELNGKTIPAYKVKTTLPDWRSAFWASYYWYRASDGILIKSKETRGPPGTAETTMELVKEQVLEK